MDPNITWRNLCDHIETASHDAENLAEWIKSGGFIPDGMTIAQQIFVVRAQEYLRFLANDLELCGGSDCLAITGDDQ
jgi:hypothetical protein